MTLSCRCRCLAGILVEDHPDQNHLLGDIDVCSYPDPAALRAAELEDRFDPR